METDSGSRERFRGYPVLERHLTVAGRTYVLCGPANHQDLLDDPAVAQRFEQDEYMPYWADLWPAATLLAEEVATWEPVADGTEAPTVLELGCGLGLVGLVAAARGYRVTVSDYDEDALAFVLESARRNGIAAPSTRLLDWRERYADLVVDRIVAADVLYETRNLRPLAEFVYNHLRPDGFALIGDPNRTTADAFDTIARHCDLTVELLAVEGADQDAKQAVCGRLFRLRPKAC